MSITCCHVVLTNVTEEHFCPRWCCVSDMVRDTENALRPLCQETTLWLRTCIYYCYFVSNSQDTQIIMSTDLVFQESSFDFLGQILYVPMVPGKIYLLYWGFIGAVFKPHVHTWQYKGFSVFFHIFM